VTLRVHPDDRERSDIDRIAGARGFDVVEDGGVGRGGCVLEAQGVTVDASIEALLHALRSAAGGACG
jgi:flagellar biosynthesis/type III secretory pathway protein FliH